MTTLVIPALLGAHVIGPYEGQPKPPLEVVVVTLREKMYQYNMPIHIGKRCWIGAGAVILPGVTIGDNTVIGAGSVVTKDIPANVVAAGNPCRVLREIGDHDREYYFKDRKIDYESIE